MLTALLAAATAAGLALFGGPRLVASLVALVLFTLLAVDRVIAGVRAALRFSDFAGLLIAPAHLLRGAWVAAALVWGWRRLWRHPVRPWHSMRSRSTRKPTAED